MSALIDLSANTSYWGPSPSVLAVLSRVAPADIARYPGVRGAELRARLGRYVGVGEGFVTVGCGSDELLDAALRAFAGPGERVAYPDPTFGTLVDFTRANRLTPVPVPLTATYAPDVDALISANAPLTYVCSPNNPTGGATERAALERLLSETRGLVILDEAYAEFSGVSNVGLVAECDRLLVLRTMSKAFGLAGLRVGYAVAQPRLLDRLDRARPPFPVNVIAEKAACTALGTGIPWMLERVAETVALRERFQRALASVGIAALPSCANFVLVYGVDTRLAVAELERVGVRARVLRDLTNIGDAVRVTIGPWAIMEQCAAALRRAVR